MTTLKMNFEFAKSTSSLLSQSVIQIQDIVLTLDANIQDLVTQWMGNSANEFLGDYNQWAGSAKLLIEQLETLNNRLAVEMSEWENMAAKLG